MKVRFDTHLIVPPDIEARNIALSAQRNLPRARHPGFWHDRPLAVVGSGPRVVDHLAELKAWPGDVWAVNHGFVWCRENGISATFMTADPVPWDVSFLRPGDKALLAACCDPAIYAQAAASDVTIFDIMPGQVVPLSTSISCAATLGPIMGYRKVVFFGAESCYLESRTNVIGRQVIDGILVIACNGGSYAATPQLFLQAELMSAAIRRFPGILEERSGGLLGAMVADPDYDVLDMSPSLRGQVQLVPPPLKEIA